MTVNSESGVTPATLDPPGTIAVVGAGPLGMEAALYGRFLGYKVTLLESNEIAHSLVEQSRIDGEDQPIPMLPDRSLSPLALSALRAQAADSLPVLPTTIGEWINMIWSKLAETDLLRDRIHLGATVTNIDLVDIESNQEDDTDSEFESIPPDFQVTFLSDESPLTFEAVILATGKSDEIETTFDRSDKPSPDYWFQIGRTETGNAEVDFLTGLKEIVSVYASLAGRENLDLYLPARS